MEQNKQQTPGDNNTPASTDKKVIEEAHTQAEKDMEDDAEFTASSPNDDLDEEESAKLGEENPL